MTTWGSTTQEAVKIEANFKRIILAPLVWLRNKIYAKKTIYEEIFSSKVKLIGEELMRRKDQTVSWEVMMQESSNIKIEQLAVME